MLPAVIHSLRDGRYRCAAGAASTLASTKVPSGSSVNPSSLLPVSYTHLSDAFPTDKVHLVDPGKHEISDPGNAIGEGQSVDDAVEAGFKAGLFTFSEVVFDTAHTHAALNYTFHCGSLCGHGGTVVFILSLIHI